MFNVYTSSMDRKDLTYSSSYFCYRLCLHLLPVFLSGRTIAKCGAMPVRQTRSMSNHPEIPRKRNIVSEHICLLSPEHPDIPLNPNPQAFPPVSPMLGSPNSEFVNHYNLRCMVDLLADDIVSTEIDQDESDNEGEDLPGDILPCDDQPRCTYYTVTTLSMKV